MDDGDGMLLKSLQSSGIQTKDSIAQFAPEDLISICLQYLQLTGLQQFEISSIKTIKSIFRQAGKIQEHFEKQALRLDIQTLMNPNLNDSRRLIVNLLQKLSQSNKKETHTKKLTFEERVLEEKAQMKNAALQQFFIEWVNPSLLNHAQNQSRFLKIHILNILKQDPLIKQVANPGVRKHLYNSLVRVMDHHESKTTNQKYIPPNKDRIQLIKKMRRSDDPDALIEQFKGQLGEQQEQEIERIEWQDLQKGNRQIKKALRQMKEDDKEEQDARKIKEEENKGLFNLEIQFQEEVKEIMQEQTIDQAEMQQNVEDLSQKLKEQQKLLEQLSNRRQLLEEKNQKKLDEYHNRKEENKEQEEKLENSHLVLQQIENKSVNDQEIKKIEDDIESIRIQWDTQKIELQNEVDTLQSQVNERKLKLDQIQDKLRRLQEENQMIRNQGKVNLDKKEQLIIELQQMPKEVARGTYIKKINDLRGNLEKQRAEYIKVAKEVQQLEDSLDFQNNTISRYYIELENLMNSDPKKIEQIAKYIFNQYQNYKGVYKQASDIIRDIGNKRIQVYEAEILMETLSLKGYKKNVEKLKQDLQEIKQENERK